MADTRKTLETTCCIAGGGPAGMMLGFLLARAGVDVTVLEKHADFLRDFRGDTIHPSTLEIMKELGLLEAFLALPHQEVRQMRGFIGGKELVIADLSHLPVSCRFIALMPQWDFLNFLAGQAKRYPSFRLAMQTRATGLIEENGRIAGITAETADGPLEIRATLTIGADGRHSTIREKAGLTVQDVGAPIDVLWMRLSRSHSDPAQPQARFGRGQMLVMLERGDYWQCAYVIAKGGYETIQRNGLAAFRESLAIAAPFIRDRVSEIAGWDEVKLLTVTVDYLHSWFRPGLLCIGDAAHAMSPVGGVGINLAIQDAVAAANFLSRPLREGRLTDDHLRQVQRRRAWPARLIQKLQVFLHNRVFGPVVSGGGAVAPPWLLWALEHLTFLRRIPARIVGMGFRPEHIRTDEAGG